MGEATVLAGSGPPSLRRFSLRTTLPPARLQQQLERSSKRHPWVLWTLLGGKQRFRVQVVINEGSGNRTLSLQSRASLTGATMPCSTFRQSIQEQACKEEYSRTPAQYRFATVFRLSQIGAGSTTITCLSGHSRCSSGCCSRLAAQADLF
jgi:hypothetical protein